MSTQYTPPPVTGPKNGLGLAGLILGLAALIIGVFMVTFGFTWVLAILGLIFGLIGLSRVHKGVATNKGVALAGVIASALAIILGIIGAVVTFNAVDEAVQSMDTPAATAPAGPTETITPSETPVETPAEAAPEVVLADGDWAVDTLQIDDAALGVTSGTVIMVNNGAAVSGGTVQFTLRGSDGSIGTLSGLFSEVAAGANVTVSLLGSDVVLEPEVTAVDVNAF